MKKAYCMWHKKYQYCKIYLVCCTVTIWGPLVNKKMNTPKTDIKAEWCYYDVICSAANFLKCCYFTKIKMQLRSTVVKMSSMWRKFASNSAKATVGNIYQDRIGFKRFNLVQCTELKTTLITLFTEHWNFYSGHIKHDINSLFVLLLRTFH